MNAQLRLVVDRDLALAREAAANVAKRQGYPTLCRGYLAGDWDGDSEVLAALEAIRLSKVARLSVVMGEGL
jgi:hypothetical protein